METRKKYEKYDCLYKGELLNNVSGFRYACEHHENPFIDCSGEEHCQYKKCIADYLPSSIQEMKETEKEESIHIESVDDLFDEPKPIFTFKLDNPLNNYTIYMDEEQLTPEKLIKILEELWEKK